MRELKTKKTAVLLIVCLFVSLPFLYGAEEKKTTTISTSEYNQLMKTLSESMLLPLGEYRKILVRIAALKKTGESKDTLVIESSKYNIKILENNAVRGRADLKIKALRAGWHHIASSEYFNYVESILLDGKKINTLVKGRELYVEVKKPGSHKLNLNYWNYPKHSKNSKISELRKTVLIGLQTDIRVEIPEKNIDVNVADASILSSYEKGSSTIVHLLPTYESFKISWNPKKAVETELEKVPLRLVSSVMSLYQPGQKHRFAAHLIAFQAQRGETDEVKVALPPDYKIVEIAGDGIKTYKTIKPTERTTQLVVTTKNSVKDNFIFLIRMEKKNSGDELAIFPPRVIGAERQTGFVAVSPLEPAFLVEPEQKFYRRMDVRELPPELGLLSTVDPAYAWQYRLKKGDKLPGLEPGIQFQPVGDVLTSYVRRAHAQTQMTADGVQISRINYSVVTSTSQFLRLELEPGQEPLSVFVGGKPVPAVHENRDLVIPLKGKKGQTSFGVEITLMHLGREFAEEGEYGLVLPQTLLPVREFVWQLWLPDTYEYEEFSGNIRKGYHRFLPPVPERGLRDITASGSTNNSKMLNVKSRIEARIKGIEQPDIIEINCDNPKNRNKPVCKRFLSEVDSNEPAPPPSGIDRSSSTLSLRIEIPRKGTRMVFHSLLLMGENPKISFSYEIID